MTTIPSSPTDIPGSAPAPRRRCAIYTRKSIAKGLDQEYNSLDAQFDLCMDCIRRHEKDGWVFTGSGGGERDGG